MTPLTKHKILSELDFRYLPVEQALTGPASGFCEVLAKRWWVVHRDKGLMFFWSKGTRGLGSPQCNSDKTITDLILKQLYPGPEYEVRYFERVIVPIQLRDYTD